MQQEKFAALAKRHFAKVLGVEESKVEELYDYVNTHFRIEVRNNNPDAPKKFQTFTAVLCYDPDEEYSEAMAMMSFGDEELGGKGYYFDEFSTPEIAIRAAYKHINSVEFLPHNGVFHMGQYPLNMLVLFDKDPDCMGERS